MSESAVENMKVQLEPGLGFAIAQTFSVAEAPGLLLLKQEPHDEEHEEIGLPEVFGEPLRHTASPDEMTDDVVCRAVSPPRIDDPIDHVIENSFFNYKEKYQLKEVTVGLERCDKIWETLQLIKNIQGLSSGKISPCQSLIPVPVEGESNSSELPIISNGPKRRRKTHRGKNYPEFRFSIRNGKKLFHCLTCRVKFTGGLQLRDHAISKHGIYYNPKRMYRMKPKICSENEQVIPKFDENKVEKSETGDIPAALLSHPKDVPVALNSHPQELIPSNLQSETNRIDSLSNTVDIPEKKTKIKVKCVLCKRLSIDINHHLKVFHKVGCISSIIKQCEEVTGTETQPIIDGVQPENETVCEPVNAEDTEPFTHTSDSSTVRKRKRKTTNWTMKRKKFKTDPTAARNFNSFNKNHNLNSFSTSNSLKHNFANFGKRKRSQKVLAGPPFKCPICFGLYQNIKSFADHKRKHLLRGETKENFDRTNCSFKNSPFHVRKGNHLPQQTLTNIMKPKKVENSQPSITNYMTIQKEALKPLNKSEELISHEKANTVLDSTNKSVERKCECGRFFRSFHTMHLHKIKCNKKNNKNHLPYQNLSEMETGIGISIKLKKNENDSYEVVPNNTPFEDTDNGPKSSRASDVASDDSGMVLNDYKIHKITDSSKSPRASDDCGTTVDCKLVSVENTESKSLISDFSKSSELSTGSALQVSNDNIIPKEQSKKVLELEPSNFSNHSILRIQVAEDDEDVDIEDGDSVLSGLDGNDNPTVANTMQNCLETAPLTSTENTDGNTFNITSEHPSNLTDRPRRSIQSQNSLSSQTSSRATFNCHGCAARYEHESELMEHMMKMQHNVSTRCPCGKKLANFKVFNIHVKKYHEQLLNCGYCKTSFERVEYYLGHKCEASEGKPFIEPIIQVRCMECETLVDIGEPFDKHVKTHYPDEPLFYQCFKCELRFNNSYQRRSHFSKMHGFCVCRICGKVMHFDYLAKHEAYHDGSGFPCHSCKKAFTQKSLLKKHSSKSHTDETVQCTICSKKMKLGNLKKHMSFHLHAEICRKCDKICDRGEQKNLENHITLEHPNGYPALKCKNCNKSFLSNRRYEEHFEKNLCVLDRIDE